MQKEKSTYMISRYSLTGQLLETYPNAKVAAQALGTSQTYISKAARTNNKVWTARKYLWRRGNEPVLDLAPMLKERWYGASPVSKNQKTIGQYDLQGNLINTYTNTVEAGKAVGIHHKGIRDVIKGRGLTYGGFIWNKTLKKKIRVDSKITSKIEKVSQYDLDGRWVKSYDSCLAAAQKTKIDNGQIHHCLNGHLLTAGGYLWRKGEKLRINTSELRKHPRYPGSKLDKHIRKKKQLNTATLTQKELK
ncbi:NUMOD1 domain-containing DNA-binding protein [Pedobacter nutrimenti]|uniref:NUMOD1 domain-containing DNA-binding protein n=1 Tax=Pedobacter nutrimenti TaxID=1241337 RepID=UPI002930C551|nr:NUMOD1 domain-containing DNA-binding protein [Pedobacter nutrimenti]